MNEETNNNDLEVMKKNLENERLRRGYAIDEPFKPISDKNTMGRIFLSIFFVTILVALVVIAISIVALQNAGHPLEFPFIN